jgi:hypothetical protein
MRRAPVAPTDFSVLLLRQKVRESPEKSVKVRESRVKDSWTVARRTPAYRHPECPADAALCPANVYGCGQMSTNVYLSPRGPRGEPGFGKIECARHRCAPSLACPSHRSCNEPATRGGAKERKSQEKPTSAGKKPRSKPRKAKVGGPEKPTKAKESQRKPTSLSDVGFWPGADDRKGADGAARSHSAARRMFTFVCKC